MQWVAPGPTTPCATCTLSSDEMKQSTSISQQMQLDHVRSMQPSRMQALQRQQAEGQALTTLSGSWTVWSHTLVTQHCDSAKPATSKGYAVHALCKSYLWMESATASTAWSCPTTRRCSASGRCSSFSRSGASSWATCARAGLGLRVRVYRQNTLCHVAKPCCGASCYTAPCR